MPLFDFACKKCGEVFEHTRPFGNKENPKCAMCGSKRTEKILTPPAIHFKGGGFYKTDSSTSKPAPPKKEKPKEQKPKDNTPKEDKTPPKAPPAPTGKKE